MSLTGSWTERNQITEGTREKNMCPSITLKFTPLAVYSGSD